MASPPKPPYTMTKRQEQAYDKAYNAALVKAGGVSRLSHELSQRSGQYISHQAVRNWKTKRRIPPEWALVMEEFHEAANFFDLVPWLRDRFEQEAAA